MAKRRRALLVGATGLVGSLLLERLLDETTYSSVTVWARRPLALRGPGLKVETFEFEGLASHQVEAEHVFCCLGTTMKLARSEQAFRRVDYDYPVALARAAKKGGATRLLVVSALGANPDSRIFYNRVKGEMEAAVAAAGCQGRSSSARRCLPGIATSSAWASASAESPASCSGRCSASTARSPPISSRWRWSRPRWATCARARSSRSRSASSPKNSEK